MSKYNEFSVELEKHIQELTILNTKIKNCTGLSKDDTNSLFLLNDIIKTYRHLKAYPTAKLQQFTNNTDDTGVQDASDLSQILDNDCDDVQNNDGNSNKSIFCFENSDDELDDITDEDEFEIDVGNNKESRDAYKQHQDASMLRLKHVINTKWYNIQKDECDSDEDYSEDESCEDIDIDGKSTDDTVTHTDELDANESNILNTSAMQLPSAPPRPSAPSIPSAPAPPIPYAQTQAQTVPTNQHNTNLMNNHNSATNLYNEFKEMYGEQTQVCKPLCHITSLEPLYC
jgi:hypothetical protein